MRKILTAFLLAAGLPLAGCVASADRAATVTVPAASAANPVQDLLARVDIPYETFTLANGLRVAVHTDRKAPVVAISIWYNVGSKDEPVGRSGFAHLFEHLLFYGSENAPGDFSQRLENMGATDWNGSTWFDRTNYYETVPTAALETALFLESDRMGHLLGAVTEEKLRNQISVVQNEKRQGDNEPYGMVEYAQLEALFPVGHPYRHSTIGSMADLDAASLQDVHGWFRENYGPNNAVLVLAGDIDLATARRLVERYFGDIPRGSDNVPAAADVPTLARRIDQVMSDNVATTRLYRQWVVPGLGQEDNIPLQIGAAALGGLASSRLDNLLVRGEQTAVAVTAAVQTFQRISFFEVTVDVKPGADADAVSRRLDRIIADYIRTGPTEDEVRRVATQTLAARIRGLEQVGGDGGKAVTLAEGLLYMNDAGFYRRELEAMSAATPARVRGAMQRWLNRPVYALRVVPGERGIYEESASGRSNGAHLRPRYFRDPDTPASARAPRHFQVDRSRIPEPGPIANIDFPEVEHATLSNGIRVAFARRATVPVVRVSLQFDAGYASDSPGREGLQSLMAILLDEGTATRSSIQIAEEQERLGAMFGAGATPDRTFANLAALRTNLAPSLDLLADIVRNPAFAPAEIERVRAQRLAQIAAEQTSPFGIAQRTLPPLIYGQNHPYGIPFTGSGNAAAVRDFTRDDIVRAHQTWVRPDNLEIFVVGDTSLAEITRLLEERFGRWQLPQVPRGTKGFAAPAGGGERIVLIDRPQSPQSLILGGVVLPAAGTDELLPLLAAIEALGGGSSARLYQDLRETRGWSYGAYAFVNRVEHQVPLMIYAPVQANRTGESVAALRQQVIDYLGSRGTTAEEQQRVANNNIRGLPGSFETSVAVLAGIADNALYNRPDNYQETIAGRYRALTAAEMDRAARAAIDAGRIVWVVVGDAAQVRPQIERLGLPIETMALQ